MMGVTLNSTHPGEAIRAYVARALSTREAGRRLAVPRHALTAHPHGCIGVSHLITRQASRGCR
jgi:hypothetical protein